MPSVRGEKVNGRGLLVVRRFEHVEDLADCQILFISRSERARLQPVLQAIKGRSVHGMTVSDLDDFAAEGGVHWRFVQEDVTRSEVTAYQHSRLARKPPGLSLELQAAQARADQYGPTGRLVHGL